MKNKICSIFISVVLLFSFSGKSSEDLLTLDFVTLSKTKFSLENENSKESSLSADPVIYGGKISIPFVNWCFYKNQENLNFGIGFNTKKHLTIYTFLF